jgi:hypothetical protein
VKTIHNIYNAKEKKFLLCFCFTFFLHHILLTILPFVQLPTMKSPLLAPISTLSSCTIYLLCHAIQILSKTWHHNNKCSNQIQQDMAKTKRHSEWMKVAAVDAKIMKSQHVINAESREFSFTNNFSLIT